MKKYIVLDMTLLKDKAREFVAGNIQKSLEEIGFTFSNANMSTSLQSDLIVLWKTEKKLWAMFFYNRPYFREDYGTEDCEVFAVATQTAEFLQRARELKIPEPFVYSDEGVWVTIKPQGAIVDFTNLLNRVTERANKKHNETFPFESIGDVD